MAEYREIHCPYGDDFEGGDECNECELYELCLETYPPLNLIEIPKGATREQVFEAVFGIGMMMAGLKNMEWWNAPYKGSEE